MISPGFFGLYNAQRGLMTSQNALDTVNHNIANANTAGYSRQQVTITEADPYTNPSIYDMAKGQLGQGSVVQEITRIRDSFLDTQFQNETSTQNMVTQMRDILQQLQGITSEPSTNGINTAVQNFFDSAQAMSISPENQATRSSFIQSANNLLTVFQQQAKQLYSLRQNVSGDPNVPGSFATSQIGVLTTQINSKLQAIAGLNQQIITIKASGAQPNDLLDKRGQLLDDLSKMIDIQVTTLNNGMINVSVAGGTQLLVSGPTLVDTLSYNANPGGGALPNKFNVPGLLTTTTGGVVLNDFVAPDVQGGQMKGLINMAQVDTANPNNVNIRSLLSNIDTMFSNIAAQVNSLQSTGRDLTGTVNGLNLFTQGAANPPGDPVQILSWQVNPPFLDPVNGPPLVAAAINDPAAPPGPGWAGPGDGRNALAMGQLRDKAIAALGNNKFVDFFNGVISNLGITTQTYQDRSKSQTSLTTSLDQQRQAVSGVNVDQEMIDLLRYQRGFEASSKVVSTLNQIYQTVIQMV